MLIVIPILALLGSVIGVNKVKDIIASSEHTVTVNTLTITVEAQKLETQ